MRFGDIQWSNDQNVDRLISRILRAGIMIIAVCLVLGKKGIVCVVSSWYYMALSVCMVIFLLPTLIVDLFHLDKPWVRYAGILCTALASTILMISFSNLSFLLIILPMTLAMLYFDKQLGVFSIALSTISLCLSQSVSLYLEWVENRDSVSAMSDSLYRLAATSLVFCFFCYISLSLMKRSSKLFVSAFKTSDELKRNRDGLDVIVDNTDILFRARSYTDIISIILFLIKNLFEAIEGSSCHLRGYVAIRQSADSFFGINEEVNPIKFMAGGNEIDILLEGRDYHIPIHETDESSTVFITKDRMTMHFYVENELFAFVILHMDLDDTDEVLNKLVRVLYRNIHLAINNIKLTNDMYETQEEIVRAFSEISESKSGQTGRHIKRVSEYMKIMAEAMDLEQSEKDSLVIASMMHDIGKLLIPESIIEKPGKLTNSEFEIIKTHVKLGYKLLEYSPGRIMEIARVIALQHHEKWDGTGYLGMKGEEIDYYSRIMAVVDVFDALMSKRSYKERWTIEAAYDEIVSQSGRHFDPDIVEMFKGHFEEFAEVVNNYPDYERNVS